MRLASVTGQRKFILCIYNIKQYRHVNESDLYNFAKISFSVDVLVLELCNGLLFSLNKFLLQTVFVPNFIGILQIDKQCFARQRSEWGRTILN